MDLEAKLKAKRTELYNKYLVALNADKMAQADDLWAQVDNLSFHIKNLSDSTGSSYLTDDQFKTIYPDKVGGSSAD